MENLSYKETVDLLKESHDLTESQLITLLDGDRQCKNYLYETARRTTDAIFGRTVYLRGLVEFSNICKNDCYYCGIRRSHSHITRYRLSGEEILRCADKGYRLGFRTIVLQSGEDLYYTADMLCSIIREIKQSHPDMAVTLSIGEKERDFYQACFDAGADRFLLRHETATRLHYEQLHPPEMSYEHRMNCLKTLREIGYQTGCGFMVGSPGQTGHHLYRDLMFIKEFHPHMVGIGPFLSQKDTPFAKEANGSPNDTLVLLSIIRLLEPKVLLPATTALNTIASDGRESGLLAGANVIMPNLSPPDVREQYLLYDNKRHTGAESAEALDELEKSIGRIGFRIDFSRGDHPDYCCGTESVKRR